MKVRLGNLNDVEQLVPLYETFYPQTDYARIYPFHHDTVKDLTERLIEHCALVVVEDEGRIVGSGGCYLGPALFNREYLTAHEVVLYLDPAARGHDLGQLIIEALEQRCKELGAVAIQMVRLRTSPQAAEDLYLMNGYRISEWSYTKRLVD